MGLTVYATNEPLSFDMGYGGFYDFRTTICKIYDAELGALYADHIFGDSEHEHERIRKINEVLSDERFNDEDEDLIDFFFASDCEGKISHKTCKKIYDLIKDVDFGNDGFQYALMRHSDGDYEALKRFLKNCYSNHRKMRWT